jgi:hypothetical protein
MGRFLARLASLSFLVGWASLAAGAPDRYCLQGPQGEYPGKCEFTSYLKCVTEGGAEAKCRENPKYEYARKRPAPVHTGGPFLCVVQLLDGD